MVGVAVKVTPVPEQIGLADGDTETVAVKEGFTVRLIPVDVAGLPVKHKGNVPPEFNTAFTASPLLGV